MTKKLELHDLEAINNVAKSFDKPKTVQMSQDVYDKFKRSFYPISKYPILTEDHDIVKVHVESGELDVEIIPGKELMGVTGETKYTPVEDNDDN